MSRLNGKIALVTGASRGIGRAIALRLAEEGAMVAVHYGSNHDAAADVVRHIGQMGGEAFAIGQELGTPASAAKLLEDLDLALEQRTGEKYFDIFVNNAGVGLVTVIEETTEAAFDHVMNTNVKGPFFLIQQALHRLRDGGRIINLSSAVTRISLPGVAAYSMSKGAINTLTLSLSTQLAPRGITVNALQPGFVATDMNQAMLQDESSYQFGAGYSSFGRWGEPSDIADVAAFLASSDSRWITGQCIDVSGGSHL
ncbi:SDR family oxidoreductase [Paenibacillus sp. MMO-177]|uniref:SDR family oxidoreductase n=1 Tax=Paenibacillus sp. MMO-177 TaxID=3081289 RepID=UPI003017962E